MTTIEYERTLDDIIDFNLYLIRSSPLLQRQAMVGRIITSIIVVILSMGLIYIIDRDKQFDTIAFIIPLVAGVFFFLIFPWLNNYGIRSRTTKLLKEGSNKAMIGRQRITLQDDSLYCEAPSGESKVKWDAVERVVVNNNHVLLYLGSMNALVIPKRAFANEIDMNFFVEEVQQRMAVSKMA